MLVITDYQQRSSQDGRTYFALELTSDEPELVISQQTGRFYATVRKCFMPSTFPEAICRNMVGKQLPGSITKTDCEPYEWTVPETGEVITRSHRYEYQPVEQSSMEQTVLGGSPLVEMV
jgi:hypothetical protein